MFKRYIRKKDGKNLENLKLGKVYYAAEETKRKRVVATYINPSLDSKLKWKSKDGQILIVETKINDIY